jgi:HEAT repeat protein
MTIPKEQVIKRVLDHFGATRPVPPQDDEFALVIEHLRRAGIDVSSLEELKHSLVKWQKAIPILQRSLSKVKSSRVKEVIVRLLGVPFAKGVEADVIAEFRTNPNPNVRWAAGNSLEILASDKIAEEMISLAADESFGASRQMIVHALGKLKGDQAFQTALDSLNDDDVVLHALTALIQMRRAGAIPLIEPLLSHSRAAVRKRARKAIEVLSRTK